MMDLWDSLGQTLSDIIGSHDNNHVGWAGQNIRGYAEGGEVDSGGGSDWSAKVLDTVGTAAKQTMDKGYGHGELGVYANSPAYIAQHYTQLGKFFSYPGNQYNTTFKQPEKTQAPEAADPNEFYNRWYQKMRQFAEAEEVATRGAPQTRSF